MPASTEDETRSNVETIDIVFFGLFVCCSTVIVGTLLWWLQPVLLVPSFSVKLTDIGGLDPLRSLVIHPAFDLTVRLDNTDGQLCKKNVVGIDRRLFCRLTIGSFTDQPSETNTCEKIMKQWNWRVGLRCERLSSPFCFLSLLLCKEYK
jgi:hypothetical protein